MAIIGSFLAVNTETEITKWHSVQYCVSDIDVFIAKVWFGRLVRSSGAPLYQSPGSARLLHCSAATIISKDLMETEQSTWNHQPTSAGKSFTPSRLSPLLDKLSNKPRKRFLRLLVSIDTLYRIMSVRWSHCEDDLSKHENTHENGQIVPNGAQKYKIVPNRA